MQGLQEEQKQLQKVAYTLTPTSEEKSRKQAKSALHQEIIKLNPSGQMSMEQLIKVVLNLQEEARKLRKENEKLTEKIQHGLQVTLDLKMANQEREIDALWNYQREQFSQTNSKQRRFMHKILRLKIFYIVRRHRFNQNRMKKWRLKNFSKNKERRKTDQDLETILLFQKQISSVEELCRILQSQGKIMIEANLIANNEKEKLGSMHREWSMLKMDLEQELEILRLKHNKTRISSARTSKKLGSNFKTSFKR